MNELLIYKVAFDNIARTIKQWNNDEEAVQADFEYLMDIENTINAVGRLPDNATNGDVIIAMFPHAHFEKYEDECRHIVIMWVDGKASIFRIDFEWDWWNALYKEDEA